jgi:hypothetical protein
MIGVLFFNAGLYYCWGCAALFIMVLFGLTRWRYRQGHWQLMRVIDTHVVDTAAIDAPRQASPS